MILVHAFLVGGLTLPRARGQREVEGAWIEGAFTQSVIGIGLSGYKEP